MRSGVFVVMRDVLFRVECLWCFRMEESGTAIDLAPVPIYILHFEFSLALQQEAPP